MFSRIGDMLKVNPPAPDGGRKDGFAQNRHAQDDHRENKGGESGFGGDSVLLSLEALRAMAKSQGLAPEDARRFEAALARIAGHGLSRIPLRPGQSAAEAVLKTLSFLSSSRD